MTDTIPGTAIERFRLLRSAQKRRRGVPLYTLHVNRPVGRAIAAASPKWVEPNHLTLVGALLTYGALVWLMFGATRGLGAGAVGVALVIGFFFDSADGQLARLRGGGSLRGEWLDHVLDSGRIALLHLAALAFLLRTTSVPRAWLWLACGLFLVAAILVFFGGILFDKLAPATSPPAPSRDGSQLRSALMLPLDYGMVCVTFVLAAWPTAFLVAYLLLAAAKLVATALFLRTWYARLAAVDLTARRAP